MGYSCRLLFTLSSAFFRMYHVREVSNVRHIMPYSRK
jgi:hypothetical protein